MLPQKEYNGLPRYLALVCAALFTAAGSMAFAAPPIFELPPQASEIAKGVFDLGYAMHNGRRVRGIAFVHPRPNRAKPDNPGGGNGKKGNGSGDTTSTCYTLIAKDARWKTVEDYILDPSNLNSMSDDFVAAQLDTAVSLWNAQVGTTVFGERVPGAVDGADTESPDDKNEVYFWDIADPGTIAVTITWGIFGGPPRFRELVEWDQVYDDVDYTFGDAVKHPSLMDLLNIAAHEVGHAAGIAHPDNSCTEETMFAFASEGETKKRDLNAGDIAGIKALYE